MANAQIMRGAAYSRFKAGSVAVAGEIHIVAGRQDRPIHKMVLGSPSKPLPVFIWEILNPVRARKGPCRIEGLKCFRQRFQAFAKHRFLRVETVLG